MTENEKLQVVRVAQERIAVISDPTQRAQAARDGVFHALAEAWYSAHAHDPVFAHDPQAAINAAYDFARQEA